MEFENVIKNDFELNSIRTEFLGVDTMAEMEKTNRKFSEAYVVVRPYLFEQIKKVTMILSLIYTEIPQREILQH